MYANSATTVPTTKAWVTLATGLTDAKEVYIRTDSDYFPSVYLVRSSTSENVRANGIFINATIADSSSTPWLNCWVAYLNSSGELKAKMTAKSWSNTDLTFTIEASRVYYR